MTTKMKVALGILGAVAAGVAIGILLAPEKGTDTRKKLKKTAGDWADNLTNLFTRAKEHAEDSVEAVKEKGRSAKASAEEKVNKLKESLG
jgi:gas vesicle protein